MRILLTGGSGLLGNELQKHLQCYAPSHDQLDITGEKFPSEGLYDLIVNAAAYTNVKEAEIEKQKCYEINVLGTQNLLAHYPNTPFVYISSEYAHNPVNYYSQTKLAAETVVKAMANRYLIIRTLFKPNPYPHEYAFIDQFTRGDAVNIIAMLIVNEIESWDRNTSKTIYCGTERKTMYQLALQTKPDVKPNSINDIEGVKIPADYE